MGVSFDQFSVQLWEHFEKVSGVLSRRIMLGNTVLLALVALRAAD
jgi:hypothetical protein